MDFRIGTSGYSYKHWDNGVFYPPGLPSSQWLEYYSTKFDTVELNVTFYRQPAPSVFKSWYERTPDDFHFAVKGPRFITHIKRLKDPQKSLRIFAKGFTPLGQKIDCFLWQFHPKFKINLERLENFCRHLKTMTPFKNYQQVFEFREASWFNKDVYKLLKKMNYCLCFADSPKSLREEVLTSNYLYIRFHHGAAANSNYTDRELKAWVKKIAAYKKAVKTVYVYFNNDMGGFAPKNAATFRTMAKTLMN
jgi:uncharacterized protein YecE (DUF72 family)